MKRGFSHASVCFVTIAKTLTANHTMATDKTPYLDPLILLGNACAALRFDTLPPDVIRCARQRVLDAAYQAHPERFPNGAPTHHLPPAEVWINQPTTNTVVIEPAQAAAH